MRAWFTAAELAALGLPELGSTKRGCNIRATREAWTSRKRAGRGGGREYHVSALPEAARIELARRETGEAQQVVGAFDARVALAGDGALAGLTGRARARAEARLAIVTRFESWRASAGLTLRDGLPAFASAWGARAIEAPEWLIAALPRVSPRSLWQWRKARQSADTKALAGAWRAARDGVIDSDPALRDFVVALILDRPHVNALHVLQALESRFPQARIPGLRGIRRWIARWRVENARAFAIASDPDRAKGRLKPAFGDASGGIVRINQLWETDATPADVMCSDGRHVVVGVIDVVTRRARVLVARSSKATAVTALLRRAIVDWGLPETLKSDNGAEFVSRHVSVALAALRVAHDPCPPFTPEGKPHIERFFGTLARELFALLPGFVGHNVAQRQAIRARQSFAKRLGESDDAAFRVGLTAAQLQAACESWLASVYERRPHQSLGRTPFETGQALASGARRIADERALDVLLAPVSGDGWRVVGKKGIRLDRFTYIAPDLAPLVGERVQCRYDVADLGRIVVYDSDGAFVCVAEDPEVTGADRRAIAAQAQARRRQIDAELRDEAKRLKRDVRPDTIAAEILASNERAAAKIVAFPVRGEEVTTPALDEAALAADALDDPASLRPRPSYEDLTDAERQPRLAEVIPLTPADPDPWPGWGEPIDIWDWSRRNPTRAPEGLTPEQLAARIESWRAEEKGLDLWIRMTLERERNVS